jgi:hypothetical protein
MKVNDIHAKLAQEGLHVTKGLCSHVKYSIAKAVKEHDESVNGTGKFTVDQVVRLKALAKEMGVGTLKQLVGLIYDLDQKRS